MTREQILQIAEQSKLGNYIRLDDDIRSETVVRFANEIARAAQLQMMQDQEPAAEVIGVHGGLGVIKYLDETARKPMRRPLYTKPTHHSWQELTDQEIKECWHDSLGFYRDHRAATREIMRLLKEKNT